MDVIKRSELLVRGSGAGGGAAASDDVATLPAAQVLEGIDHVMVFFSAKFCGPCAQYKPILTERYNTLKAMGRNVAVIFCSGDRSESDFNEWSASMPQFPAIPWSNTALRQQLSSTYASSGIPTLTVFSVADDALVCEDAVEDLARDESCSAFPYAPPTWEEATQGLQLISNGSETPTTFAEVAASKKAVCFYYSASWCGPCRSFSPAAIACYNAIQERDASAVEFILVPWDRSQAEAAEYFAHMPWKSIRFGDPRVAKLNKLFKVGGIPTMITLDPKTGVIINKKVRAAIAEDPTGAECPWVPKPPPAHMEFQWAGRQIEYMTEDGPNVVMLNLHKITDAAVAEGHTVAFKAAAEAFKAANPESGMRFVYTTAGDATAPDPTQCPAGHPLQPRVTQPVRCDGCGEVCPPGEQHMGCDQDNCDIDVCVGCFTSGKAIPRRDIKLWSLISRDVNFNADAAAAGQPYIVKFTVKGSKSAPMTTFSTDAAQIAAFASAEF